MSNDKILEKENGFVFPGVREGVEGRRREVGVVIKEQHRGSLW